MTSSNSKPAPSFDAAFYLRDIASLDGKAEQEKFLTMPMDLIQLTSPDILAIPEVRNHKDVDILNHVYKRHACVRDGLDNGKYTISFVSELHRTNDSRLFRRGGKGWPLTEGKNFHQFISDYSKSEFTIMPKEGLNKTKTKKEYKSKNHEIHNNPILTFRDVASATNIRTMISCIMPPRRFFSNSCPLLTLQHNNKLILDHRYYERILYLTAIFNSMTFDYLIRLRTNTHLNFFIINSVAIPHDTSSKTTRKIIELSGMLTMQSNDFAEMAESLQFKIKKLGTRQRIETITELDALVAHHYGLERNQYEYILSTFRPKRQNSDLDDAAEWSDNAIHAINYKVKKQALNFYDRLSRS